MPPAPIQKAADVFLERVRNLYSRRTGGKIAGIPGHKNPTGNLRGGLNNGIGQFDFAVTPHPNSALGNFGGKRQGVKVQQKGPHLVLVRSGRSYHDFHPGDDADGTVGVAVQFNVRWNYRGIVWL